MLLQEREREREGGEGGEGDTVNSIIVQSDDIM